MPGSLQNKPAQNSHSPLAPSLAAPGLLSGPWVERLLHWSWLFCCDMAAWGTWEEEGSFLTFSGTQTDEKDPLLTDTYTAAKAARVACWEGNDFLPKEESQVTPPVSDTPPATSSRTRRGSAQMPQGNSSAFHLFCFPGKYLSDERGMLTTAGMKAGVMGLPTPGAGRAWGHFPTRPQWQWKAEADWKTLEL